MASKRTKGRVQGLLRPSPEVTQQHFSQSKTQGCQDSKGEEQAPPFDGWIGRVMLWKRMRDGEIDVAIFGNNLFILNT